MTETRLLCSPRLALKPAAGGWRILDKSDWASVGEIGTDEQGNLSWLEIEPGCRRRGYASEAFACLHDHHPTCIPAVADGPAQWLQHLGYRRRGQRLTWVGLTDPDNCRRQAAQARLKQAAQLGVPDDYSKRHGLPECEEPDVLVECGQDVFERPLYLEPQTARQWRRMVRQAAAEQIVLQPVSGFRSLGYQSALVQRKLAAGQSPAEIYAVNAAPGFSEHHSGRALDITSPGSEPLTLQFARTPAFAWLTGHAAEFGFRLSYPENNPHGLQYEPWHWAYT